jgi:hypothetical protein
MYFSIHIRYIYPQLDDDIPPIQAKYYKVMQLDPLHVIISRKRNKVR